MRLNSSLAPKLLAIALLAFFLIYWVPFSHALPGGTPFQFGTYRVFQASEVAVWAMVALGLNILTGYNGQISLGHSAFVATGGYVVAILMVDYGWPFWATVIMAGLMAGALGFVIGVPALRLRGPYLAIATMALALATPQVLKKYDGLTHGSQGISVRGELPTPPGFLDDMLTQDEWTYFLALFIAFVMTLLAWNIIRSRVGRAFVAIRDSEVAAAAMGISVPRYKTLAFAISAFFGGVAGATYVQVVGFISPESFNVLQSINFLTTIVVGGLASLLGSVLGAVTLVMVPELPDVLGLGGGTMAEQAPWVIYGASLILVVTFMPSGIAGAFHRLARGISAMAPAARSSVVVGLVLGMIAIAVVGQVASGGMGVVVGVVLFLGITSWLWLPALGRRLRRAWELQIEALRGTMGSAGLDPPGPEDGPSG